MGGVKGRQQDSGAASEESSKRDTSFSRNGNLELTGDVNESTYSPSNISSPVSWWKSYRDCEISLATSSAAISTITSEVISAISGPLTFPDHVSSEARAFVTTLLHLNPSSRPAMGACLALDWLTVSEPDSHLTSPSMNSSNNNDASGVNNGAASSSSWAVAAAAHFKMEPPRSSLAPSTGGSPVYRGGSVISSSPVLGPQLSHSPQSPRTNSSNEFSSLDPPPSLELFSEGGRPPEESVSLGVGALAIGKSPSTAHADGGCASTITSSSYSSGIPIVATIGSNSRTPSKVELSDLLQENAKSISRTGSSPSLLVFSDNSVFLSPAKPKMQSPASPSASLSSNSTESPTSPTPTFVLAETANAPAPPCAFTQSRSVEPTFFSHTFSAPQQMSGQQTSTGERLSISLTNLDGEPKSPRAFDSLQRTLGNNTGEVDISSTTEAARSRLGSFVSLGSVGSGGPASPSIRLPSSLLSAAPFVLGEINTKMRSPSLSAPTTSTFPLNPIQAPSHPT